MEQQDTFDMNRIFHFSGLLLVLLFVAVAQRSALANDLAALSDEFSSTATAGNWQRRFVTEAPGADPLERWEINAGDAPGAMLMMPHTVSWFQPYRGPLVYKAVTGDFAITTHVEVSNRQGTGMPGSEYSLAGIMLRSPLAAANAPENYVSLSLGYGDVNHPSNPGPGPHFEVKTTENGTSNLHLSPAGTLSVDLQFARLGETVVALYRRPGEDWTVHRVYERDDFPETLQVGLVAYTDWNKVSSYSPDFHNTHVLAPPIPGDPSSNPALAFRPDLVAEFDYARFVRPIVPEGVDPATASQGTLLSFLGDSASWPYAPGDLTLDGMVDGHDAGLFAQHFGTASGATWATGDFDADGAVTILDLALLQANLSGGMVLGAANSAPASVPEPSALGLFAIAIGMLGLRVMLNRSRRTGAGSP
jgi:hypothetical protein